MFLTRLKLCTMRWSCMVKSASFSTDNSQTSRFSFFYRINFLTIKFSSQNISITLGLTDSALTSRTSRRPYWRKKAPVNNFVTTVPVAKKYCCKWWRWVMASFCCYYNSDQQPWSWQVEDTDPLTSSHFYFTGSFSFRSLRTTANWSRRFYSLYDGRLGGFSFPR